MNSDTASAVFILMVAAFIFGYILGKAHGKLKILERKSTETEGRLK